MKSTKINAGENINVINKIGNVRRINPKPACIISPSLSVTDDLEIDNIALASFPPKVPILVRNTSVTTIKLSAGDILGYISKIQEIEINNIKSTDGLFNKRNDLTNTGRNQISKITTDYQNNLTISQGENKILYKHKTPMTDNNPAALAYDTNPPRWNPT